MDKVEIHGLKIAYRRRGRGPAMVCVHGYVGDSRTWRVQFEELSDAFTMIAWDAPGFGESDDPGTDFRLADYADCLAGFVRALDLGPVHMLGLSFGGGLAIEWYRRHPRLAASLVLVSAYAGWAGSLPEEEIEFRLHQALQLADLSGEDLTLALMPTMFSDQAPAELVEEFAASIREFHPAGLRATARAFAEADLRGVLPTIAVPTLLVYGEDDERAPRSVAEQVHAQIESSRLVVIPGAGHIVNIEAAASFNAAVRDFLTTDHGGRRGP